MTALLASLYVTLGLLAAIAYWVATPTWNPSNSVPPGWYMVFRYPAFVANLHRDDLITFCTPPLANAQAARMEANTVVRLRGNCADGFVPFIKHAAALPGDVVRIVGGPHGWIEINGVRRAASAQIDTDPHKHRLSAVAAGTYVVAPGTLWALGTNPHSWDSRYWGPVPIRSVSGRAFPLYVKN